MRWRLDAHVLRITTQNDTSSVMTRPAGGRQPPSLSRGRSIHVLLGSRVHLLEVRCVLLIHVLIESNGAHSSSSSVVLAEETRDALEAMAEYGEEPSEEVLQALQVVQEDGESRDLSVVLIERCTSEQLCVLLDTLQKLKDSTGSAGYSLPVRIERAIDATSDITPESQPRLELSFFETLHIQLTEGLQVALLVKETQSTAATFGGADSAAILRQSVATSIIGREHHLRLGQLLFTALHVTNGFLMLTQTAYEAVKEMKFFGTMLSLEVVRELENRDNVLRQRFELHTDSQVQAMVRELTQASIKTQLPETLALGCV